MRTKSTKPKKQRLYQYETPRHEAHKVMSSNLSPNLREGKGFRSIPLRKGDTVTIMRGEMKGKSGKITKVDSKKQRVYVDKVQKRKTDNTEIAVPIHPSNLMITKLEEKDRTRLELINRRIKNDDDKIDIEAALAVVEEEGEDVIELEDEDLLVEEDDEDLELLEDVDETDDINLTEDDADEEEDEKE